MVQSSIHGMCWHILAKIDQSGIDLSFQVVGGGVFGGSTGFNSPNVIAGMFSSIGGVSNTIVVSGCFGYLLEVDFRLNAIPLIIAIFPNGTFNAYSGSLSAINLLASGN